MISNFLGQGLYTISQVSRYTRINKSSIKRWVKVVEGDHYYGSMFAVYTGDYQAKESTISLSFNDLLEIRFIHEFRKLGVSLQTIRKALVKAQTLLNENHPFSTKKFLTDGKEILYELSKEDSSVDLMNILTEQYEFQQILDKFLHNTGLEFSPEDTVCRWWPNGKANHVVLDPQRAFGQSIIGANGVPTAVLHAAYRTELSIGVVADWYEIDQEYVSAAVKYEESLTA